MIIERCPGDNILWFKPYDFTEPTKRNVYLQFPTYHWANIVSKDRPTEYPLKLRTVTLLGKLWILRKPPCDRKTGDLYI